MNYEITCSLQAHGNKWMHNDSQVATYRVKMVISMKSHVGVFKPRQSSNASPEKHGPSLDQLEKNSEGPKSCEVFQ
jgi:hypothetical protein